MFQAEGLVEAVFRRQVVWAAFGVELPLLLGIINSHSPWAIPNTQCSGMGHVGFFRGSLVFIWVEQVPHLALVD